jgi:hypothetical protein
MTNERRRAQRYSAHFDVAINGKRTGRLRSSLTGFSRHGGQLLNICLGRATEDIWITLPGLAPQRAKVCWASPHIAGFAFANPLHPAVAEHLATLHGFYDSQRLANSSQETAAVEPKRPASRRQQIRGGYAGPALNHASPAVLAVRPVG